jgi:hypothetical protein
LGEERKVFKVLVGKLKGKRPLRRPRHGIGMALREIGFEGACRGFSWFRIGTDCMIL